ncbi:hypothetical protein BJV78DRAFT_544028 [Lactifluus subvellereus]|nr:hypothetical protein BJV78DRAFT_544028 [Lactifluus subvellereus]
MICPTRVRVVLTRCRSSCTRTCQSRILSFAAHLEQHLHTHLSLPGVLPEQLKMLIAAIEKGRLRPDAKYRVQDSRVPVEVAETRITAHVVIPGTEDDSGTSCFSGHMKELGLRHEGCSFTSPGRLVPLGSAGVITRTSIKMITVLTLREVFLRTLSTAGSLVSNAVLVI